MTRAKTARAARLQRHLRLRQRLIGTFERPRLCVFRSLNHIYVQIIDDTKGHTLASASTLESKKEGNSKTSEAREVGRLVAERARAQGFVKVVFDRAGYKYHGRVKNVADAAREGGLDF